MAHKHLEIMHYKYTVPNTTRNLKRNLINIITYNENNRNNTITREFSPRVITVKSVKLLQL